MEDALRIHARPALREPALILAFEGWNDAGEAATSAARHLMNGAATALLAEIDPEEFYDFTVHRPEVEVDHAMVRRIDWPTTEFRYGAVAPDRDLVVGVGVEPHLRWNLYGDRVVDVVRETGIRRVVLFGSYLADVLYSRPVRVTGIGRSAEALQRIGVEPTRYQGPTGIVGVLGERLRSEGIETASLWAGLPHYVSVTPNPRGALALLQCLGQLCDWRLDLGGLERRAGEFEERVSALIAADPELTEYVRQLKRREFAQ